MFFFENYICAGYVGQQVNRCSLVTKKNKQKANKKPRAKIEFFP